MATAEAARSRPSTGGTLTTLAMSVIESRPVRRVRWTRVGRQIWATPVASRASRSLHVRYAVETATREVAWRNHAELGRRSNGTGSTAAETPFVILCQARTGSNLVQSELRRRWPAIRCLGEEYGPNLRLKDPDETTADITKRVFAVTEQHPVVGCRLFYEHVTEDEFRDILAIPGLKVVHLQRRNVLRRYVSLQIAVNNRMWVQGRRAAAPSIDDRAVTIDVDRFIRTCTRTAEHRTRRERILSEAGVEVLDVWYEDVADHLDTQLRRIAAFLGLGEPMVEDPPLLTRQNPEPLRLLVKNYAEVRAALSPTQMRHFLDPEDAGQRHPRVRWRRPSRTCWPSEQQELLLRAALHPPREAGDALVAWQDTSNPYDIDEGSRRLYPMVHRNLRRTGVTTTLDSLLWDRYVQTSGRNQVMLRTLERVLEPLHDADVPTLVLKGAALTLLHYRDRGARPMSDLDVMVPPELMDRALELLRADGWDNEEPFPHAVTLRRGDDELDLHSHALDASIGTDLDAAFWDASVEMEVGGQRTRALGPADQLLHAFAHGLRYNPVPPLRWIADAHVVITSSGCRLDWDRLVRLTDRHRLAAYTSAALAYLDRLCPSLVPPATLAAVRALPVTRRERHEFERSIRDAHWLQLFWRDYRRSDPDRSTVGAVVGFPEELRVLYDLDHVWQVPERAVRGLCERRRRDVNGPS
jgi:LPS sulfotransferase NodH